MDALSREYCDSGLEKQFEKLFAQEQYTELVDFLRQNDMFYFDFNMESFWKERKILHAFCQPHAGFVYP